MTMKRATQAQTVLLAAAFGVLSAAAAAPAATDPRQDCMDCHKDKTPVLFNQWNNSHHAKNGIGCYECHQAQRSAPDKMEHEGTLIKVLVTPKDCSHCHPDEVNQFAASAHASAADLVTGSAGQMVADFMLGMGKDPSPAAASGCFQCHGTGQVLIGDGGQLEALTWPSTGVGRVNPVNPDKPDNSKGRCATCHSTHAFSGAEARRPESCALCHGGSTAFNVFESYRSSAHGTLNAAGVAEAPTCADCHMSIAQDKKRVLTHNVGATVAKVPGTDDCEVVQRDMMEVCKTCHVKNLVDNFFDQYQAECKLVLEKWQKPVKDLYCQALAAIRKGLGPDYVPNTYPINHLYLQYTNALTQAKRGAAMGSPRITDQNNLYLAQLFYSELVPEFRDIFSGRLPKPGDTPVDKVLQNPIYGPGWPPVELESCDPSATSK